MRGQQAPGARLAAQERAFCLYFSLASSFDENDEDQAFAQDLLDFFVDSIGATLTDINDATLK